MDIKRITEELGEKFSTREIEEMIREADQDCKLACLYFCFWCSILCSILYGIWKKADGISLMSSLFLAYGTSYCGHYIELSFSSC